MFVKIRNNTRVSYGLGVLSAVLLFLLSMQIVWADTETNAIDIQFQVGASVCGNSIVDLGEDCDDGNLSNTDACLNTCTFASCGDGFVEAGSEACDAGGSNGSCPASCSAICEENSCGGSDPDPTPNVSIVETVASHNSIGVNWTATGGTITTCTLSWTDTFGGALIGSTDTYTIDGSIYSATASGLASETLYYITVTCTNNYARTGTATDNDTTTAAPLELEKTITVEALAELRQSTPYGHENLDIVVRFIDPLTGVPISEFAALTDDVTGIYTGIQTVPIGTDFVAEIKGISHLSKRIVGVDTTAEEIVLDFTDGGITRLRAGDVRSRIETNTLPEYTEKDPLNDDIIEGADLSLILSYFGTTGDDAYKILDLNRDGEAIDFFITEGSELSTVLSRFGTVVTY